MERDGARVELQQHHLPRRSFLDPPQATETVVVQRPYQPFDRLSGSSRLGKGTGAGDTKRAAATEHLVSREAGQQLSAAGYERAVADASFHPSLQKGTGRMPEGRESGDRLFRAPDPAQCRSREPFRGLQEPGARELGQSAGKLIECLDRAGIRDSQAQVPA
jgi:hypothetical protein